MISEYDLEHLKGMFGEDTDFSVIKEIIYFDWWSGWSDSGGCLIFKGIDDSLQAVRFGSSPYGDWREFDYHEIDEETMKEYIDDVERMKKIDW